MNQKPNLASFTPNISAARMPQNANGTDMGNAMNVIVQRAASNYRAEQGQARE